MNSDLRGALVQSRREFLATCAVLGLSGCHVVPNARLARRALVQPEPEQWQPILRAFAETVVSFEHPRFPRSVRVEQVTDALYAHFPVKESDDFGALRLGLWVFDDTALFPEHLEPFVDGERKLGASEPELDSAVAHDRDAFQKAGVSGLFSELGLAGRRRYLNLWAKSAFTLRRQLYRSGKILTMIATYSLPEMWTAIGYEGPLLRS
ncbi:MAG TPA: hypothetical protein VG937_12595 [Polyangiaceae bacterium]|nr:hypothetical protein [Polyangiaceae bacterium]